MKLKREIGFSEILLERLLFNATKRQKIILKKAIKLKDVEVRLYEEDKKYSISRLGITIIEGDL